MGGGRRWGGSALGALLLGGAALLSLTTPVGAVTSGTPGNSNYVGAPPEVTASGANQWPLPDHDYNNSRDAGASPIDAATVSTLRTEWSASTGAGMTTSPIVVDDRVYAETNNGTVIATSLATGAVLWQSESFGPMLGPDGVTAGWGDVFATIPDGVVALNQSTGKVVWTRRLTTTSTEGVNIQPTIADGLVFAATTPISALAAYTGGDEGWLFAIHARTGAISWKFNTVDSPDLWGNPTVNSGGGAWYPPAIDASTGRIYWGTANPAPYPGTAAYPDGSSRPGDDLYTDSTLALSLKTGQLIWYHQATPHDLRDYDFVHSMIVDIPGKAGEQVIVGTGKSGKVVGLKPNTGGLLWRTPVGTHENDYLKSLTGPTVTYPGTFGGVLTPPASAGGTVYVATLNDPTTYAPGQNSPAGKTGQHPGDVVAVDATNGKVLWSTAVNGDPTGGATVVNNLVLTATFQGHLLAINRFTGRIVWRETLPGAVNGWMSVVGSRVIVPIGGRTNQQLLALKLGD